MRPAPWGGLPARFGGGTRVPHVAPGYFIGTPCYTNPSYSGSFFCSQFLPHHRRRPFFGQTQFVPSYYGYYPPAFYSGEEAPAMAPAQDNALASQVEDLSSEVEMLREQQSSREDSRPVLAAPQVAIPEKTLPTVFAYHDGHQFETQNYAILDQTLWVFGGQTTRKIPLAELDLAATKKLNDERGVDFSPPQAR